MRLYMTDHMIPCMSIDAIPNGMMISSRYTGRDFFLWASPNAYIFRLSMPLFWAVQSPARQRSVEEVEYQAGDLVSLVFERKVSSVEQMQLGTRQIS